MATRIEQNETYVNKVDTTLSQMQRLINGLAPDPREWEYDGECNDLGVPIGHCACGHPIRFEFVLHRKRDNGYAVVGSVCIDYYALISPAAAEWMRADMERMLAKIRADKKAAEQLRLQAQVEEKLVEYSVMLDKLVALADAHRRAKQSSRFPLTYELWKATQGYDRYVAACPKFYKTAKLYVNWYVKHIGKIQGILERNTLSPDV